MYESCKSGGAAGIGFDEHLGAIDGLYQKLDEVNEKINGLRHKAECSKCGFLNDEQAVFCSRCGAKLGAQQTEAPSADPKEEKAESDSSI